MEDSIRDCKLCDIFGTHVFDDRLMQERLPEETYRELKKVIDEGRMLDAKLAEVVANAMKDWAVSMGATHYTHWFQPLNGCTAEKYESFMSTTSGGGAIMEFSGKMLIKGESDASSFPSGGLRCTFEARGYTMWDPTSPAFLKEDKSGVTLCIPTAFCSYTGESLDEKTPLLRAAKALETQSLRLLHLFGDHQVKHVRASVGAEQEYFLIDLDTFQKREDLKLCGRTLFGARPPKCQEMDDHYYASLGERVSLFMKEIDEELWSMGVSAKTKHNEAAPCQHELAPIFTVDNISADQNQLIMETLHRVALRHRLVCLLHEKPFAYVNGSGKHNNWSLITDDGQNLFEPGDNPYDNAKFLLFLCAVIRAIDLYAPLLRAAASSAGNDQRLGGYEAPPSIVSLCLGESILSVLRRVAGEPGTEDYQKDTVVDFGIPTLPQMAVDATDRNRTSPFAFTGSKFEFRMLGSSMSVSWVNATLNTMVAESLDYIATRLEKSRDFDGDIVGLIREIYEKHGRIIYNGNSYDPDWPAEAAKRGLPCINDAVSGAKTLVHPRALQLFDRYGVCRESEMRAREEVMLERYGKHVLIEARTMVRMVNREIYPAVMRYATEVADSLTKIRSHHFPASSQEKRLEFLSRKLDELDRYTVQLGVLCESTTALTDMEERAARCRDVVLPLMHQIRGIADALELIVDKARWPIPSYQDILFNV
ncbi:glutamine synthetase III family protein [Zongyangia hominis]|uniref:Glutamine synthetase III n=1 Tax=Zongyangia hominis TaxID=2763677 RepID=A0A926IB15_9FIRM|nr:glutamine synthetase III [Zongyangia hominis]MBC8569808.1 glutamine synthetase III [Zongyangia hominis]